MALILWVKKKKKNKKKVILMQLPENNGKSNKELKMGDLVKHNSMPKDYLGEVIEIVPSKTIGGRGGLGVILPGGLKVKWQDNYISGPYCPEVLVLAEED